ncbi:MAG: hypothetical protein DRI32_05930 [Chloroflexi bacterium]|nr:MAG: hypothetical protein DRI32_05930 [Chloroflexota bacterium]
MTLLTLFSSPKPFTDPHINIIQRNAIESWTHLKDVQVILLGDEEGEAEAARDLGVLHLPNVDVNEKGTPLISSMLDLAREHSDSPLLGIVNADILLMDDITRASQICARAAEKFVLLGQRWDLDVTEEMDFSDGWQSRLLSIVHSQGTLHPPKGSDYFIFPRNLYADIPNFAIGRAGWDNWFIYKARAEKWDVIDATSDVQIVHQNHDYRHLASGKIHYSAPETKENRQMAGGVAVTHFTIRDATRRLVNGKVRANLSLKGFVRRLETLPLIIWDKPKWVTPFFAIFHPLRMMRRIKKGSKK